VKLGIHTYTTILRLTYLKNTTLRFIPLIYRGIRRRLWQEAGDERKKLEVTLSMKSCI